MVHGFLAFLPDILYGLDGELIMVMLDLVSIICYHGMVFYSMVYFRNVNSKSILNVDGF